VGQLISWDFSNIAGEAQMSQVIVSVLSSTHFKELNASHRITVLEQFHIRCTHCGQRATGTQLI